MKQIKCNYCLNPKSITEFRKNKNGHSGFCDACRKLKQSKYYANIRKLRREEKTNMYPEYTLEYTVFDYFKRQSVYLSSSDMNYIVTELENADNQLEKLSELQNEYRCNAYESDSLLQMARQERFEQNIRYIAPVGGGKGLQRPVFQYNLELDFLQEYSNLKEASLKVFGDDKYITAISNCATGKNLTGKGFVWSYFK